MKLYEVNQAITELLMKLEPDPDTGEVAATADDVLQQLDALQMKKSEILEYIAKLVLDTRASADALKAEEKRLHDRRGVLERREERLMGILDR